jgi:transposase
VAYGRKGKGILIHSIVERGGMPLSCETAPANSDERAQVLPLPDSIHLETGKVGRPRKRVKVLTGDKGYDSSELRRKLRKRGIRPQLPKRVWGGKRKPGRPIKNDAPRFQVERTFSWLQRKYRRLVVRWERIESCFQAFPDLAFIHIWLKRILVG